MSHTEASGGGRRLLNATAIMASGTMVSRVLGFVRAALIAFVLGNSGRQVEAFNFANTVPTTLYLLLAGGTLNNVLVPQIVRSVAHDSDGGKAFLDRIITGFVLILGAVTIVVTAATPVVMSLFARAWTTPQMAEHWQSLLLMSYLCMPQLFFYGVFFLIGQVLNSRDSFGPMMWAPIANNVVSIGVFGLYLWLWGNQTAASGDPFTQQQALLLALGSTLGIIVQTVVLLPYLKKAGVSYRPRFDLRGTGLGPTFHVAKWMLGYVALTTVVQMLVSNLAAHATSGAQTGAGWTVYQNAYLIWIVPHSLLTVSLATAMLPSASRHAVVGNLAGVTEETNRALRLAITFLMPASIGLTVLADPITRIPFGNGAGAHDYIYIAWALLAFAIGLVPFTIQYLYLRAFFAMDNTKTPFLIQIWISAANAVLAVTLAMAWDDPTTLAARLALAYSLSYFVGVFVTHFVLRRRLPDIDGRSTWQYLVRLCWATLPAAGLAWIISWWFARYPSVLLRIVGLALAGLVAVLAFFFTAKRLGVPEATTLLDVLRRRRRSDDGSADAVEAILDETADQESDPRGRPAATLAGPDPATSGHPDLESATELINSDPDGAGVFVPIIHPAPPEDVLDFPEPPATDFRTPVDTRAGRLLGERYLLGEQLAVRGRTQTWRAQDAVLGRPVLVHLLPTDDPATAEALRLARDWAPATDSRFLRVLDVVDDPGVQPYLVYEYAAGQSLAKVLADGPLTGGETAWIVREVADALIGLHAQGSYHRQLSPATVLVTPSGNVKVLGAGVADVAAANQHRNGEAADIQALGRILYACLVHRWPGGQRFGMAAAPTVNGWPAAPSTVRTGVPPALDAIADRVLSPNPRANASRIVTAQELTTQLSMVLGPSSAAAELGARLNPAQDEPPTPLSRVVPPMPTPVVSRFSVAAVVPEAADEAVNEVSEQPFVDAVLDHSDGFTPVPPPVPATAADGVVKQRPRRLPLFLGMAGLVVAIVVMGATVLGSPPGADQKPSSALAIAAVDDFDPKADGGSGAENAKQVSRAIDGDPATAWKTERYRGLASFGGLKPGAGLVLDLGTTRTVTEVSIDVVGAGTTVDVRVPSAAADQAPMKSESQWTRVASVDDATGKTSIALPSGTSTRFLLIYLTSLPGVGGGYYQGGIAEVSVTGH